MCSTYPTCRIAAYSLGYVQDVENRFSLIPHGGDTTTNVQNSKTKTTSSAASTNLNAIIFTSSAKRNDTDTIIFAGVRYLETQVHSCKVSTSRSLKNLRVIWQTRKKNCKAIMRRRVGRTSTHGWRKLSEPEVILRRNSNPLFNEKTRPLDDLTSRGAENFTGE